MLSVDEPVFLARARPRETPISDPKAKAAAQQIGADQGPESDVAMGQQYDAAQYHLSQINSDRDHQGNVAADQAKVAKDKATLPKAAVANYVSDGTAATAKPDLQQEPADPRRMQVYNKIAEGDISPRWPTCTRPRNH